MPLPNVTRTTPAKAAAAAATVTAVAATALGLLAAYAYAVERARPELVEYTVEIRKPGLPPGGLAFLHVSDLHLRAGGRVQGRKLAALSRLAAGARYDVLAITGDLIHNMAGFPVALAVVDALQPDAGQRPVAAAFVPGNHDYCESSVWGIVENSWAEAGAGQPGLLARLGLTAASLWRFAGKVLRNERVHQPVAYNDMAAIAAGLADHGVRPLVNQAVHLASAGADLWLAGIDDQIEGTPDLRAALAEVPPGAPLVLLAHNPDVWLDPLVERADLVLAGHTHGGQIHLPLLGAIHTQGTHLRRRRAAGWFCRGATRMFVSRGAGESLPLRLGARPQLAVIRVVSRMKDGGASRPLLSSGNSAP